MVEAAAAGAFPLLPDRLAYPEVFAKDQPPGEQFFYDGSAGHLAERLGELADRYQAGALWMGDSLEARRRVERYGASRRAGELDDALQALTTRAG
jgi:glycosyltransferase involved in cell wall biosynthesis